ncbi:capsular polysaccharide biosynthesis protein [Moraxella marmotae]|uniref:capsular polysaccharide biosynthesis protein n=1 Tax=Moraxella marmotae TaxID=3344520 RepID=UPI0035F386A7
MQTQICEFLVATQGIIRNNQLLANALGVPVRPFLGKKQIFGSKNANDNTDNQAGKRAVLAWGQKPSAKHAQALADKLNLPLWRAEDGFLRSLDSGVDSRFGASFVLDDLGIYFDLTKPNRLQCLIEQTAQSWNDDKQATSVRLMDKLITHRLSKYNAVQHAPNLSTLANNHKKHILIIDQVAGDASILGASADKRHFLAMISQAKAQYPDANLWIKTHPAGKGYLATADGVGILSDACNPIALLEQVDAVFTVSSHMGFEALMLGKTVHCFGVSWYCGFGLTDDTFIQNLPLYQKLRQRYQAFGAVSVAQLFFASYIAYSHYADPATGKGCDIETVMDYLICNRHHQNMLAGDLLAYDFSRWKVDFVKAFVQFPKVNLTFKPKTKIRLLFTDNYNAKRICRNDKKALAGLSDKQQYLVWGLSAKQTLTQKIADYQNQHRPRIWCMEDGFIRSNGLGATLLEPLSVVVDDVGIYFDANYPSQLEIILQNLLLDDEQIQRANNLHRLLLANRVSKYNVGTINHRLKQQINAQKSLKPTAKVRLVVGQVEDDASVKNCTSQIRTNAELLKKVRADFADDVIIYKPHPDIEAGLRLGKIDEQTLTLADIVATDTAMPQCLELCDVVHTISSLTGFEALLRGVAVVCYGLPFYAGFGLTDDVIEPDNTPKIQALARRQRTTPMDLPTLIYGTLIAYPLYRLPNGHGLASCEQVIEYLYNHAAQNPKPTFTARLMRQAKTRLMQLRKFTI